jgi:REP element-mobilizing transposase RayT
VVNTKLLSGPDAAVSQDPRSLPWTPGRLTGRQPPLARPGRTYFVTIYLRACGRITALPDREPGAALDLDEIARKSEPVAPPSVPLLGIPRIGRVVESSLLHFQGERYALHAWCVMPDHVHVLVTPFPHLPLERVLHAWKSFTAHEANRMLHRSGPLWQREAFDHLVRDPDGFETFLSYIEADPVSAGLCARKHEWPFSSARYRKALSL